MSLFKREEYKDDLNQCKDIYQMKKFYEKNKISDDGKSSNNLPVYWKEDINRYKHANCVDTAICAYCISRENDIPAKIYCIDFDCSTTLHNMHRSHWICVVKRGKRFEAFNYLAPVDRGKDNSFLLSYKDVDKLIQRNIQIMIEKWPFDVDINQTTYYAISDMSLNKIWKLYLDREHISQDELLKTILYAFPKRIYKRPYR